MARLITDHIVEAHALPPAGREHAAITRARAWLDARSDQNVSIRFLADLAGRSPYYLVRTFHRQVGVPPDRYQAILRVNCARTLLAAGVALPDVAYRTGFCDQSHLTRCCKSTVGVTPGSYSRVMSKHAPGL